MATQTGKRYTCSKCGSEFVVTRGSDGDIKCCNQPMQQKS
ncbi:MAG: desulfoferrodoxin [Chloroflexi bacterium]|nr:desulfoferrodoxin [Chloroflexota bacterium]